LYNILGEVLRRRQYLGYQDVDGKIILENWLAYKKIRCGLD
jgi:hypothetical protein